MQQGLLRAKWILCSTRYLRVSEKNVTQIQERFECSPRKSTRRASWELGVPQTTVWYVLRRHLLLNWAHPFESFCIMIRLGANKEGLGDSLTAGEKLYCFFNFQPYVLSATYLRNQYDGFSTGDKARSSNCCQVKTAQSLASSPCDS